MKTEGGNFWIEYHQQDITTTVQDTSTSGTVINLDRPGTFVGVSAISGFGSNLAPIVQVLNQNSTKLIFGVHITGIKPKLLTAFGTGAVGVHMMIFLRKTS